MPIKGLTEEIRRIPRHGKIRLGVKKEGAKGPYPSQTDHFVIDPESKVAKVYGTKPKSLKVMLPNDDLPPQWYKCYSSMRGLICKGDGETATALIDKKTGHIVTKDSKTAELREVPCDPDNCPMYQKKQCRRIMNLQVILPDVDESVGVHQIDTSSFNSIVNINSAISMVSRITGGRVGMIPMNLRIVPQEVQPEGVKKTVHVLTLDVPFSISEIAKYGELPPSRTVLPPPSSEAPEDLYPQEVIDEEKAPQEEEPAPAAEGTQEPGEASSQPEEPNYPSTETGVLNPPREAEEGETPYSEGEEEIDQTLPPPEEREEKDESKLRQQLHTIASDIDSRYYDEVIRPKMQSDFGVDTSKDLNKEQVQSIINWLNTLADNSHRNAMVKEIRKLGITDSRETANKIKEITGKRGSKHNEPWIVADTEKVTWEVKRELESSQEGQGGEKSESQKGSLLDQLPPEEDY